jgi:hypothetical protein
VCSSRLDSLCWGKPLELRYNHEQTVVYLQELEDRYPGLEHIVLGFPMGASVAQFKKQ